MDYFMDTSTFQPSPSFRIYDRSNSPDLIPYHQKELERLCDVQRQASFQQLLAVHQIIIQREHNDEYHRNLANIHNQTIPFPSNNINEVKKNHQTGKAKKRAEHNAIERARRESLNSKFQLLAHSLPNLQDDQRPSKGTIIERTLEYVKDIVEKEESFQQEIDQLREANRTLFLQMAENDGDDELVYEDEEDECTSSSNSSIRSGSFYSDQQETSPMTDDFNIMSPDLALLGDYQFISQVKQDTSGLNLSTIQDIPYLTPYTTQVVFNENQFYF